MSGLRCGTRDLHCITRYLSLWCAGSLVVVCGLSCCGTWDLSFPTRHQTCVSPIARQLLNHWTSREVPWTNKKNTERVPCWSVEEADYSHFSCTLSLNPHNNLMGVVGVGRGLYSILQWKKLRHREAKPPTRGPRVPVCLGPGGSKCGESYMSRICCGLY